MDSAKKAAFVKAMGKSRPKFAKGGLVRRVADRKYFAPGGIVNRGATNPNTGVLGTVGAALGLNNNFQADSANLTPGTDANQIATAYANTDEGLRNQQGLANTLSPQATGAAANQNALAAQELAMSQGRGPNPALAQLQQQTGQNINSQAALQAGQRGASGNVGLMARQIGQQGAATQQQAVGQGATQAAQQQIAAQQNLANLSNQQVGQAGQAVTGYNTAAQNEQNIIQNANTSYNNAQVGMQSNVNNANAATAQGNQGMMGNILGTVGSAASALSGGLFAKGGMVEKEDHVKLAEMNAAALKHGRENFADGGMAGWGGGYAPIQALAGPNIAPALSLPNPGANNQVMKDAGASLGKGLNSLFTSKKSALPADGPGSQEDIDSGGLLTAGAQQSENAESGLPLYPGALTPEQQLNSPGPETMMDADNSEAPFYSGGKVCEGPHDSHVANFLAGGGPVKAMVSPGEIYLSPEQVHKVVHEGADPAKIGHKIGGKAKVKGDSLKNDTVPADLEEGGVVVDRKNMGSKEKRQLFVHRAVAKARAGK